MRFEASVRLGDDAGPVPSDLLVGAALLTSCTLEVSCRSVFRLSEFPLPSIRILVAFSTFTMCSHIALVFLKKGVREDSEESQNYNTQHR